MATFDVVVRRVWNGPFYIGKLQQPATVGDVLLKVLETLWRIAMLLVALVIGFIVAVLAYEWLTPILFPPLSQKIAATVTYDDGSAPVISIPEPGQKAIKSYRCTKDYPIRVDFTNNSSKTIRNIVIDLNATMPNHSRNVIQYSTYQSFDGILQPHYSWTQCYQVTIENGYKPESLIYTATVSTASE